MFIRDIDVVRVIHAERLERDLEAVQIGSSDQWRRGAPPWASEGASWDADEVRHIPRASIRRIVGRSIVRFGSWLAAEQQFRPVARSR
jgi:hypothetical protein